jgi:hypothetical protein
MNLFIFKVSVFTVLFWSLIYAVAVAQDHGQRDGVLKIATNQYSALALELIAAYQPRARIPGLYQPRVLRPPGLRPEHLEDKYRPAWEELLLARVTEPVDLRVARMGDRIIEALGHLVDAQSVPALAKAFRQTTGKEVDQHRVISVQNEILSVLLAICNTDSLEAILTSLDLADERYGNGEPERVAGVGTLREMTFDTMMQPNNLGKSDLQRACIERSKKWRAVLQAYQNLKLSPKNREFLEKAKALKRSNE